MSQTGTIRRLRAMTPEERRFRAACAIRVWRDRVRHRVSAPSWDCRALAPRLSDASPLLRDAARALRGGHRQAADEALAEHFRTRNSRWTISARGRDALTGAIAARFPAARADAVARADQIVAGRYDLLGYRGLTYGRLPDWHVDVVHGRKAPRLFWADVPYLAPACGDHKVTWELNRHQHWMSLGRAFWLTGNPDYARVFVDQLYSWIDDNPPLTGINWSSMLELAFRAISWTWALEFFTSMDSSLAGGRPWRVELLLALDRQLAHIAGNLSRYFSPNTHLSGEALALYAVSLALPELRESAARAALGRDVMLDEGRRQILADGGHVERSTHYHRYSTDFYLLAAIVAMRTGDSAAADLRAAAHAQAGVLRTLSDEAGHLQTIGDDDGGQLFAMCGTAPSDVRTTLAIAAAVSSDSSLALSPPTEEAWWVAGPNAAADAGRPGSRVSSWPSRVLPESGYFVSRAPGALAIFDAGRHGFLNGGHAHADALALVTTLDGHALLIDPGTGTYTMDAQLRDRLRSGRLHNTLLVDGREHATVRGPFHWSATTDASFLATRVDERCDIAQGVHDGYPGLRHVRTLCAVHGLGWLVIDHILGSGHHRAESFWHVHPSWVMRRTGSAVLFQHASGRHSGLASTADRIDVVDDGPDAIHAPEYGRVETAPFLRLVREGPAPLAIATFIATDAALASTVAIALDMCNAGDHWDGVVVRVTAAGTTIHAAVAAPRQAAGASAAPPWPAIAWGPSEVRTDARAAIGVVAGAGAWQTMLDGTVCRVGAPARTNEFELAGGSPGGRR